MVKADPKRNYYADLDVLTNATTDEIKKSFRALGIFPQPLSPFRSPAPVLGRNVICRLSA
jgi:hypothetical protein